MANETWEPDLGEEDDEDEVDQTQYKHAKDALLFAIEVSASMLQPIESAKADKRSNGSALLAALESAYRLMTQRIISSPNDMMGILLYGTKKTKFQDTANARGGLAYPNCYLLTDLTIPSAEDVKSLRSLLEDEAAFQEVTEPSTEPVSMANVLFCANQIFATRAPNFASRRLFIVTDNDDPHSGNKALKSSATVRAKDLYDLGVIVELFPISHDGKIFDRSKFYNDLVYNSLVSDPEAPAPLTKPVKTASAGEGISLLQSLLSSINSRAVPKRALFSNCVLELGPGLQISVKGYVIFKRQEIRKSCYVWTHGERAQIAKATSNRMADDTGRTVDKVDIRKAYKFGGAQISFSTDELAKIRYFGEPGIRIIGFKPITPETLPIWANVKTATFIYPSEEAFVGSSRAFSALQQKLLRDNKMGLAWFIARKNAVPQIVAVVAGSELLGEHEEHIAPAGLWLIPLPYADDIRQNPDMRNITAPDPLIDRMRLIIQQLQLPKARYFPSKYPNPTLQWHYRILQAMALEEELPDQAEDKTIPRYKQIHKRAGEYVRDWGHELDEQHRLWEQENRTEATSLPKRPAPSAAASEAPKRVKTEPGDAPTEQEMKSRFAAHTIGKLSVAALRLFLKEKGLGTDGLKAQLVERVEAYFER